MKHNNNYSTLLQSDLSSSSDEQSVKVHSSYDQRRRRLLDQNQAPLISIRKRLLRSHSLNNIRQSHSASNRIKLLLDRQLSFTHPGQMAVLKEVSNESMSDHLVDEVRDDVSSRCHDGQTLPRVTAQEKHEMKRPFGPGIEKWSKKAQSSVPGGQLEPQVSSNCRRTMLLRKCISSWSFSKRQTKRDEQMGILTKNGGSERAILCRDETEGTCSQSMDETSNSDVSTWDEVLQLPTNSIPHEVMAPIDLQEELVSSIKIVPEKSFVETFALKPPELMIESADSFDSFDQNTLVNAKPKPKLHNKEERPGERCNSSRPLLPKQLSFRKKQHHKIQSRAVELQKKTHQRHTFSQGGSECSTEASARRSLIHLPSLRLLKNTAHGDLDGNQSAFRESTPDLMKLNASEDHDDYSADSPTNHSHISNNFITALLPVLLNCFLEVARKAYRTSAQELISLLRSQYAQKAWFSLLDIILYLGALFLGLLSLAVLVCIRIVETSAKWIASRQIFHKILLQVFGQVQQDRPSPHSTSRHAIGHAVSSPGKRFFVVGRKRMHSHQLATQRTMAGTNSTSSNNSSSRWILKRKSS